jgi:polysaccharide transporter, PST family
MHTVNSCSPTRTRVARGAAWLMSAAGLSQTISLLIFFVTARLVSADDFGLLATCLVTVELLKRILIEPFATSLLSQTDAKQADFDNCFVMIATASIVGALIIVGAAPIVAIAMDDPRLTHVMQLTVVLLVLMGLSRTHEVWLVRKLKLRPLAVRSIIATAGGGAIGIGLALKGLGIWALVGQQLTAGVLSFALLWLAASWRPTFRVDRAAMTRNFRQARHIFATNLLSFPMSDADIYIVMASLGANAAGIYNAAKRIAFAANMVLVKSVNTVALGTLSNIADSQRRGRVFLEAVHVVSLVTTPFFVGLALLAHDLVGLVLGERWLAVTVPLSLLALASLSYSLNQLNAVAIMVAGRASIRTWLTAASAVAIILVVPQATAYGTTGVAGAVALIAAANYVAATVLCAGATGIRIRDYIVAVRPAVVGAFAMLAVSLAMPAALSDFPPLARLALGSTALATTYLFAIMAADFSGFRKLMGTAIATVRAA